MAWYRCRHKGDGGVTPVGDATDGDVLSGKTYMNALGASTGTMPNRGAVSPSGLNCGGSYTIPAGYHNGSGKVTANSLASQTKVDSGKTAVTAGTMVSGYQGWVNGTKITGTFTAQAGSASPSTSSQTKYPDSGKYFNSFTVSAISPQRSAGTAATLTGIDSTGPYVYFPYGWWPQNNTTYGNYTRMTAAQAVTACPKEEKSGGISPNSTTALVVTPSSGKLLSKVSVSVTAHTATWTPPISTQADMGEHHSYRYANTKTIYDSGMVYYQKNRAGYIVIEGWARGECYARQDVYDFRPGLKVSFFGMRTDKNKKIRLVNASNGYVYYDSGYTSAASLTVTPDNSEDTIALSVYLYSQTGDIQYANFSIAPK